MVDTPTAGPNPQPKEPSVAAVAPDENGLRPPDGPESVEALEEALAAARIRLQERLAGEIETQRYDLEKLKAEYEQRHTEANAMVAQANETAARVLREANEASEQVRREASESADHTRREATEASERMLHEASEASERKLREASEVSERMLREATENARVTLSQAQETANALLTRLRDQAGSFLPVAAAEVERVEKALASSRAGSKGGKTATPPQSADGKAAATPQSEGGKTGATPESEQTTQADKEGPSRWIRSALKGRAGGQSGTSEAEAGSPSGPASPAHENDASRPAAAATEPAIEAVVTRLVVHPLVGINTRIRIKDRFEEIPGIQAIKLGPTGDESFELLVIHPREAKVLESVLAVDPDEILLREQKAGYLEVELKGLGWVEEPTEAGMPSV